MKKICFLVLFLVFSILLFPQKATSDIYGTVMLADGTAIPAVNIILTGEVIGKITTVSSEYGNFRFLELSPGKYELKFELDGFKTVIRKNIRVFVGKNIKLNIQMETTTIREEIVVSESPSVIDVRKSLVGVNVSKEMIKSLPTARNPWTVMNLVPGILLDRDDVGGYDSGQQQSYYGHGTYMDDSTWHIDGANITNPGSVGAAPAYLNINVYEEFQVTIGSTDITAQTGGVQLNFVTKRAGNRFSGYFHLHVEDKAWEMSNELPEYYKENEYVFPGINRLYQYGVSFGGPIIKDKWWFYGSWAIQDIHARTELNTEDATWLASGYGKTNFQLGNTSGEFRISCDNKLKWGRNNIGAANQSPGTLWDQKGPAYIYIGQLQHVLGNLMLNARVAYTDGGFVLDPRGSDVNPETGHNEGPDFLWYWTPTWYFEGSYKRYMTNENTLNLSLDGNYFAEELLGGDHEIKFGVDYYTASMTSQELFPNQRTIFVWDRNDPGGYKEIWWEPDFLVDVGFKRYSFYVSDTATFGKLTVNLGVRYDHESGSLNESTNPGLTLDGIPIYTDYLGDLYIPQTNIDAAFSVISPRLSLCYDITGDGKNVVKATFARYGSQSGNSISSHTQMAHGPWGWHREVDVYWADDGDMVVEFGEFSEDINDWYYWNVDTVNPYNTTSSNKYADDLNSPILDEFSLSFEKALGEDLAVSVTGFYKKRSKDIWYRGILADGSLDSAANWYYVGEYEFEDGQKAPFWERYEAPVATMMMNHSSSSYTQYLAVVIQVSKKFSHRWMLDASFTYSDWKFFWDRDEFGFTWNSCGDLTNYNYFNGGVVRSFSLKSLSNQIVNSRWQFKLSGLYQLPWGINITGVLTAREGYVIPYHETFQRGSGLSWTYIYEPGKKLGDDRLPTFWMLNLGIEKTFKISDTATATLFINAYNVTNNATTLDVGTDLTAENSGKPVQILTPGIFQVGFRLNF